MTDIVEGFLYSSDVTVDTDAPVAVSGDNIRPTNQVACLLADNGAYQVTTARWWFVPHWHKGAMTDWKATTFNARIEEARDKPSFRTAWRANRCVIPAQFYYEWSGPKGGKTPWTIRPKINSEYFFFAGLYSTLGDGLHSCTMLTRASESQLSALHPRTPVILRDSQCAEWLKGSVPDDEVIESFGTGWDFDVAAVEVAPTVRKPVEDSDPQGSLF